MIVSITAALILAISWRLGILFWGKTYPHPPIPPILLFCTDVTDWSLKITCGPSFKCGMEPQKKRYGIFIPNRVVESRIINYETYFDYFTRTFCSFVHLTRSISHVPLLCTLWENRLKSVVCSNAINAWFFFFICFYVCFWIDLISQQQM